MIRFRCECGRELQARPADAGSPARCPLCGSVSDVPSPGPAPAAPAARGGAEGVTAAPAGGSDGLRGDSGAPVAKGIRKCPEADTALVLGFCGLFTGLFGVAAGPIAIAFGLSALRKIRESGGQTSGRWTALGGIALGVLNLVEAVVAALFIFS
jgi:hypothetical protein